MPAIIASILVVWYTGAPTSVAVRIGIASGTAYLLSNLLDVYVFQKVRERLSQWWAAPALSSVAANIIDTFTFFGVAFYASENVFMREHWVSVAEGQTLTKIVVSALVILPTYGVLLSYLTSKLGKSLTGTVSSN